MLKIIEKIPNLKKNPLKYVFENMKLNHKPNTLWLEFGVFSGKTINYISKFTNNTVFGFDSFEGLPEDWRDGFKKGNFNMNGKFPKVNNNVKLIKGWFNETLPNFIKNKNKKVSFIHMDADLYSSTKFIFDTLRDYIDKDCVIVFDELVNYKGFEDGELKAFHEFIVKNNVKYDLIGIDGVVNLTGAIGKNGYPYGDYNQQVGVIIRSIN